MFYLSNPLVALPVLMSELQKFGLLSNFLNLFWEIGTPAYLCPSCYGNILATFLYLFMA